MRQSRLWALAAALAAGAALGQGALAQSPQGARVQDAQAQNAQATAGMPQRERDLLAILADARKQYSSAGQTLTAAQNARMGLQIRVISFMRQGGVAQDWVGTIKSHGVTTDGNGWITIEIADNVTIATWQNEKDDFNAATMFKPHSPLLQASQTLKLGQQIVFSCTFLKSLLASDDQMVTHPQFIARFSSLKGK